MSTWIQTQYSHQPTVDGLAETLAILPRPQTLAGIAGIQDRWKVAVLAMLVHQMHNDGDHTNLNHGFHSLTSTHYRTGASSYNSSQLTSQDQRMDNWRARSEHTKTILSLIFDLCTALDRLTGGSTLLFHHPGATAPGSDIVPESLKADIYVSPRVLGEDFNLHQAVAEMSQLFIERFATPLAHRFAASRVLNNWPTHSASSTTPSRPSTQSNILPLIPAPVSRTSCHFQVRGRAPGRLAQAIGLNTSLVSYVPQGSPLTWVTQAVPVTPIATRSRTSPGAKRTGHATASRTLKAPVIVCEFDSDDNYPDPGPITPIRASASSGPVRASSSSSVTAGKQAAGSSSSVAAGKQAAVTMSHPYLMSASQVQPDILVSFGPETEKVIEALGLPDTLHAVCANIKLNFLTKRWARVLTEEGHITEEDAEAIVQAMLLDPVLTLSIMNPRPHNVRRLLSHHRGPYVKVSKEFRALLTQQRRDKRSSEDVEVQAVLHYLEDKATELAQIFRKPRRHYLERFSLGSKLQRKKREKTSAWSAWVHFKGIERNSGNDKRSKMAEIINDRAEYNSLTKEEKEELVKEFDEVKKRATDRPPNITPRVKAIESAKSFQVIKEELDAMSQRVGIEAFIFMVRNTSDFQMAPKAYFTSTECEQFIRVYLRRDAARTATDFESAMLSKGIFNSAPSNHKERVSRAKLSIRTGLRASLCEVTNDASATVEFTKYEASVVCRYHVKLVGWNHPQWVNPSDLKGGVEALERVADAIKAKTCRFVTISVEEVEERRRKIMDHGAVLTPETEPAIVPSTLEPLPNSVTSHSQVTQASPSLPDSSSHSSSEPNNALADTSDALDSDLTFNQITDDLIDPALLTSSGALPFVTPDSHSERESVVSPPAPIVNPNTDDAIEDTLQTLGSAQIPPPPTTTEPPVEPNVNITEPPVESNVNITDPPVEPNVNICRRKNQVEADENDELQPRAKRARKLTAKQAALEEAARGRQACEIYGGLTQKPAVHAEEALDETCAGDATYQIP